MPATGRRNERLQQTSYSRVFTIDGGAGPQVAPVYQGLARLGAFSQKYGDVTAVRVPSEQQYDAFDIVDVIRGMDGLPTSTLEAKAQITASELAKLADRKCSVDIQVHIGQCKTPTDFDGGWTDGHVKIIEQSYFTGYDLAGLGAFDGDQRAVVMESFPFTGLYAYDVRPMVPQLLAAVTITDEVVDVLVPDAVACGNCGLPSSGNNILLALINDSSGSPGIGASVVYTKDGGATFTKSPITALAIGQTPTAMFEMGGYIVVTSNNGLKHAYVRLADLLAGIGVWQSNATGYVASKGVNAAVRLSPSSAILVGDGGYIYSLSDPTGAVAVVSAGDITVQNFAKVKAFANDAIVAIGASNAMAVSFGGGTWGLITGPSVGVALTALEVQTVNRFLVGNASGALYYTLDGGATWTLKAFAPVTAGAVRDIAFASRNVGYLAWDQGSPQNASAKLYRTINGGYSWFPVPEGGGGSWPASWRINKIALGGDVNTVFAGGLATDGNDGVLIRAG